MFKKFSEKALSAASKYSCCDLNIRFAYDITTNQNVREWNEISDV
jgi:hypothetical protein